VSVALKRNSFGVSEVALRKSRLCG